MLRKVTFLFVKDVLNLWCRYCVLFLPVENSETGKKTNRLEKEEIKKKHLLDSIVINNTIEIEDLNNRADKIEEPEDAANIIKEYEEILRERKKRYNYDYINIEELNVHKSTMIIKINVFKMINKYTKLKISLVTLNFLKNYLKDIKKVCEDNSSDFE